MKDCPWQFHDKETDRLNFYAITVETHMFVDIRLFSLNAVKLKTWKFSSMPILFLLNFIKINKVVLMIRVLSFTSSSCDHCFCAYKSAEHVK
jgi:hypothetical protein